jgi:glyoxylase-like metal-dependent hydrolase (beta-lactamase superfamily II)
MQKFQLGDVEIAKIVEFEGEIAPARTIVPDSPPELWRDNESWLAPNHWNPVNDTYHAAVQTWVLRSEGKIVLIDTGVGNDRERPQIPIFDHLNTDFLDRLGVAPAEVDVVINTHVHYDHVGWNTRLDNGNWVPAFPNATYLIPRADQEHFAAAEWPRSLIYADSIAPVLDRAVLWEDSYRVDANLTVESAPGHTPGSSIVRLTSGTDRAVFVGDMLHSPVQILQPRHNSCFDEDPHQAATIRRAVLEHAADHRELVVPAHFACQSAAEVRRDGDRFAITGWA